MRALVLIGVGVLLASCGGGDDDGSSNDPSVWHFRGVNAVADSPLLQFYVDDTAVATAEYGAATEYKPAHTGERPLKLGIRNPSDLETEDPGYADIGDEESFDFQGPTDYTVVAVGSVADPRQYLIAGTSRDDVEDNQVEYQVINAAPDAGTLAIYIKAPGAGIDDYELIDTLDPGDYSERSNLDLEVASGDEDDDTRTVDVTLQVRAGSVVTLQASSFEVAELSRLLFVVVDNHGPAESAPIKAFVVSGTGSGSAGVLFHTDDTSELRFANLSRDSGPLNLLVGPGSETPDAIASGIALGVQSPYVMLDADTYNSIVVPADNDGVIHFVNSFATVRGRSMTLYAQGVLGNIRGLLITDDRRSVPTEARFRFLHGASSDGVTMDVYLTPSGEALDLEGDDAATPNVADLGYRGVSSQLILDEGSYDVYFTHADSDTVVLGPVPLALTDGSLQTLTLVDTPEGELQLLAVNDARD